MSLNSGLSQASWTIYPLCGFVTRQGEIEDAPSAVAPLDRHSGIGWCLGLSHESSMSCQSMNVCIHSRGDVLLSDYSCEDVRSKWTRANEALCLALSLGHTAYMCINKHWLYMYWTNILVCSLYDFPKMKHVACSMSCTVSKQNLRYVKTHRSCTGLKINKQTYQR